MISPFVELRKSIGLVVDLKERWCKIDEETLSRDWRDSGTREYTFYSYFINTRTHFITYIYLFTIICILWIIININTLWTEILLEIFVWCKMRER